MHNETLTVATMCVSNPDRSPFGINRGHAAPTPTGRAEIISDDFPIFHAAIIRVYDAAGHVIETHEHAGEFKAP